MGCRCCGCGTSGGMWKMVVGAAVVAGVAIGGFGFAQNGKEPGKTPMPVTPPAAGAPAGGAKGEKEAKSVYDFTMKRIDGKEESLAAYKDKVILIVNVASECGLTKEHYPALQKLYTEKKDAGLVVLGFPSNDFKGQEPGSNEDIARFCTATHGVTFPMFEKISVKGETAHPLYQFLTKQPAPAGGEPTWNFTKYLVGRDGKVVARFDPKVMPGDPEVVKKIDELLAVKAGTVKGDGGKPGK